jgi:hypothetical protein
MPATYVTGLLFLLQAAGCAVISPPSASPPAPLTLQGGTVIVEPLPPATQDQLPWNINTPGGTVIIEQLPPLPEVVPPIPVAATPPVVATTPLVTPVAPITPIAPIAPAAVLPTAPVPPVAAAPVIAAPAVNVAPDKPVAKPPVKVAAPVVRAPPSKPSAAPARATAPTLDLDTLEQRLKDTDAIGVFTKIALKNQVDDLLKRFKAYHDNDGKPALAQLRQSYDQLLLKVNDVLKNGDPSLAGEIMGSREAIWGVLSDPVKFAKL